MGTSQFVGPIMGTGVHSSAPSRVCAFRPISAVPLARRRVIPGAITTLDGRAGLRLAASVSGLGKNGLGLTLRHAAPLGGGDYVAEYEIDRWAAVQGRTAVGGRTTSFPLCNRADIALRRRVDTALRRRADLALRRDADARAKLARAGTASGGAGTDVVHAGGAWAAS